MQVSLITSRLEETGIAYCLVGGMAAIAYGRPRLTLDADVVLALLPRDIGSLIQAFPQEDFYLPDEQVLLAEMQRESRGHFNILHHHSALRADCYLPGKSELVRWQLLTRRQLNGPWGSCWFASPAATILHKLVFFREGRSDRHLEDIRGILAAGSLDNPDELQSWIRKLHLEHEWAAVQPV